jgi:hypothetical protein
LIEKSTTKAIAFVDILDYMQQRQIVKASDEQLEDSPYTKHASTSFQSIVWMLIFDIVTIYRNAAVRQRYENSNHCITTPTKLLWRCM